MSIYQAINNHTSPLSQLGAPSIIPGRNLHFEKKLQNHYVNKALNVVNPLTEASKPKKGLYEAPMTDREYENTYVPERAMTDREYKSPQANEGYQPYNQTTSQQNRNTLNGARNYELPTQNAAYNRNSNPILGGQTYSPHIHNKSTSSQSYGAGLVTKSLAEPEWKRDYLVIKNKNGPNGNPFNIISNESRSFHK